MKKEYGGLGVLDLGELNICLLGSWIRWRYAMDKDKSWKVLIDLPKYFDLYGVEASNFWKGGDAGCKCSKDEV
jgi:hypothetical protein